MPELQGPYHPFPPYRPDYEEKVVCKTIYKYYEVLKEMDDHEHEEWEKEHQQPEKLLKDIDLAWLIKQVPEGVDLSKVKIEIGCEDRYQEDHHIEFYYEETLPARPQEYEEAMKKYKEDLDQYKKDLAAYKEAVRLQEIQEMEEKLARLKEGK